jgi:ABC-2 type transport system ATP-binding protein
LLFLDEPTAGLDPEASADLISYLKEMIRTMHTTVVICTHQLHGLESLCDEIGILVAGRLAASGEVSHLLHQRWPQHRYEIGVKADVDAAKRSIASTIGGAVQIVNENRLGFFLTDEESISSVVAALVRDGLQLTAVVPTEPTIQDLYFATVNDGSPA